MTVNCKLKRKNTSLCLLSLYFKKLQQIVVLLGFIATVTSPDKWIKNIQKNVLKALTSSQNDITQKVKNTEIS